MTPYDYQQPAIEHLVKLIPEQGAAINGSDTGTGKTLVAVEVVRRLDLPTLVVCPKAIVPAWHRTAAAQGTELDSLNYEMLRTGRTQFGEWRPPDLYHAREWFRWNRGIKFLIFDEGHRCKGYQTDNSELLKSARKQGIPSLVMSATLADSPMEMDALGYLLRMHDSDSPPTLRNPAPRSFYDWAKNFNCGGHPFRFQGGVPDMARLNSMLYPAKGVRVRIADLGDRFPETQITAELYDIENPDRYDTLVEKMAPALAQLRQRTSRYVDDAWLMAERQELELMLVPVLVDRTLDAIAQGRSVVNFVNFRLTLDELNRHLNTDCCIHGGQIGSHAGEREANRLKFQGGGSRVLNAISQCGGVGLDLHHIEGPYPHDANIVPGFDAKLLRQVFGRVHRAGGLSKSLQRVFLPNTQAGRQVHSSVSRKLNNLDALNDGDLMPGNLVFSSRPG